MPYDPDYLYTPNHSNLRRMHDLDYREPRIYMITINKAPHAPVLSCIGHPSEEVYRAELTPIGSRIDEQIRALNTVNSALIPWRWVIMPDHLHLLLYVCRRLDKHLGQYLAALKGRCSKAWWALDTAREGQPLFASGYHDRVVLREGQVATIRNYIDDNPRRLWVKQHNPDLFLHRHSLQVAGEPMHAMGNIFLLKHFDRHAVYISSRFSRDTVMARKREWFRAIQEGGVLIGSFVSKAEKRVRDYALTHGGRIVLMINHPFPERYKPSGQWFDLCREGRLLIVAPGREYPRQWSVRDSFRHLNTLSERLAQG